MFLPIIQGASLSALVAIAFTYAWSMIQGWSRPAGQALLGGLFGIAGILSMMTPATPWNGVVIDARCVMIALSAVFVGPVGAVVTTLLICACRIVVGGAGLAAGLAATAGMAAVSIAFAAWVRSRGKRIAHRHLLVLGLVPAAVMLPALLLLPSEVPALHLALTTMAPVAAANFLGVLFSGTLMLHEDRRRAVERMLDEERVRAVLARNEAMAARNEAEVASRAKSQFLASMSHELRTPLNSIIGFAEVLQQEMFGRHSQPKYREYSGYIGESGRHLLRLIDDVLDLSKIEAGQMAIAEEVVGLRRMVDEAGLMLSPRAGAAGVALRISVAPDIDVCRGDGLRLKQALLNLLSNAVKFTPRGGTVTLIVRRDAAGEILLTVRDTGPGIAKADMAKLFTPFARAGDVMTRSTEGTGLGLVITRRIMELHGGALWLESEPGRGTTASLVLPATRAPYRLALPLAASA